jgi:hypothetical protein
VTLLLAGALLLCHGAFGSLHQPKISTRRELLLKRCAKLWLPVPLLTAALILASCGDTLLASASVSDDGMQGMNHGDAGGEQKTDNPQVKELAENIVSAQQEEIEEMQQWRNDWYPEG